MEATPGEPSEILALGWRRHLKSALIVLILVQGLVLVIHSGVIGRYSEEGELQRTVEDAGVLGPIVFLLLMVLLVPLNVPGVIFVVPATTIFGTVGGLVLSLIGGFGASSVGIIAARRFGRARFESRMPPRIRRLEARMSGKGFWGVVGIRSVTFLFQPIDWLCGLSSIPLRTVLAGTFVGLILPTSAIALSGGGIIDAVM